jgi:hypothetical protein
MHRTTQTLAAALLIALLSCGCGPKPMPNPPAGDPHAEHVHGPHGGEIAHAGELHVEWVLDEKAHKLTVYVLDGTMKKEVPVAADKVLVVVGTPQQKTALPAMNAVDGKASRFEIVDEPLADALGSGKGVLQLEIDGKAVEAKLEIDEHHHH